MIMETALTVPYFLLRDVTLPVRKAGVTPSADTRSVPHRKRPYSMTFLRCLAVHMYFAAHPSALE